MKNTQTYEEVYRVYYPKVMGYMHSKISSSYEAEDLASTVFIKIFESGGSCLHCLHKDF